MFTSKPSLNNNLFLLVASQELQQSFWRGMDKYYFLSSYYLLLFHNRGWVHIMPHTHIWKSCHIRLDVWLVKYTSTNGGKQVGWRCCQVENTLWKVIEENIPLFHNVQHNVINSNAFWIDLKRWFHLIPISTCGCYKCVCLGFSSLEICSHRVAMRIKGRWYIGPLYVETVYLYKHHQSDNIKNTCIV